MNGQKFFAVKFCFFFKVQQAVQMYRIDHDK